MRFSVLHLLLLGTALAAPIQDVAQADKREEEGLVARGLVPLLARSPVVVPPKVPKPPVKPPVNGPKPPVNGPDAPGTPDTPAPLRPNDPSTPPKDTPENPGLIPPADDPKPPVTNPADDPNAPANKPDETNAPIRTDDPDGPVNLPEACGLKKRCVGKAPAFAEAPAQWKIKHGDKEIDYRQKGYDTHKKLDAVVGGEATNPPKFNGDLKSSGRYDVTIEPNAKAPNEPYLQDPRWKDAFGQDQTFSETAIKNNQDQIGKAQNWKDSDDFKNQLRGQGADGDDIMMAQMYDQEYDSMIMARTLQNPEKGSYVVKASFNNERDLHRQYQGVTGDNLKYTRPGFGTKADEVGWSDQLMANIRKSKADAGPNARPVKYIAQDTITDQTDTRLVMDGVYEVMKKNPGEIVTVRKTGGSAAESASFDALAGTVHGQRPIQMATDHHVELGNPTVEAMHILKSADGSRYDMIVEFGPPTTV